MNESRFLSCESQYKIADLYFQQKDIQYSHLHNSYNKMMSEDIPNFLHENDNTFFEQINKDTVIRYYFEYDNISIKLPMLNDEDELMFPSHAHLRNLTYSATLIADVKQMQDVTLIATGKKTTRQIGETERNTPIARIPIMVKSDYCALNYKKEYDEKECMLNPGGYFIIAGSEKGITSQEKMVPNKPLVFKTREESGSSFECMIESKSKSIAGKVQKIKVIIKKNESMTIMAPILHEISVFTMFRVLGVESDKDIMNMILYDKDDITMKNILSNLICYTSDDTKKKILTQEQAKDYLIGRVKVLKKKFIGTDPAIKQMQKKMHLMDLLENNFLPHVSGGLRKKAFYLGYMINHMLNVYIGRRHADNRDSFINKRICLPGTIIEDLFKQCYKKMLGDCRTHFTKINSDNENPIIVINQIKPNIIEQGIKTTLLVGKWGTKEGVAQLVPRLTYPQTIAFMMRIDSPTESSENKITGPRHLHPSQLGFICSVETPESKKVGLTKHKTIIANVSIAKNSSTNVLIEELKKTVIDVEEVSLINLGNYAKVLLNGEWLGLTNKPYSLYRELKGMKLSGSIDPTSSITYDITKKELIIYTDGGRMYRPVFRVEDNETVLKNKDVERISIGSILDTKNITSWNQLLIEYPQAIEYIDVDEMYQSMLAMTPEQVYEQKLKLDNKDPKPNILNRYENAYIKYSHCEIHPSLLLGAVASNIPFCNHNQGPRNMYQFSQAKHAVGIPITNINHRVDKTMMLNQTQRPIINTRTSKYLNTDKLPSGENAIVAIMCYSGYNQEDSVIVNQGAIDRGFFRATEFLKEISEIKKNQSTSQDDIFTKPDPVKVAGMNSNNYDKLNQHGYVPEETRIKDGDVVLGKITPVQVFDESDIPYKDNSVAYKGNHVGVVDKIYRDIYNQDGYGIRKARIRVEKIPQIGDKVCSRAAQKGTIGVILKHSDMPFTKNGIVPDIIMSPNAIPSRMTNGQLFECVSQKYGAVKGTEVDGTPFNNINIESIMDDLEKEGYERHGFEYLYNGMTGKRTKVMIFIGPTYYQRSKHMVSHKIHARARGPNSVLARQPLEGRAREGGLRLGEMERDCLIAHGMSKFLKERMVDCSDLYTFHVCNKCGLIARRVKQSKKNSEAGRDIFYCPPCKSSQVSKVQTPYPLKLMIQECLSINVAPRIETEKSIYSHNNI